MPQYTDQELAIDLLPAFKAKIQKMAPTDPLLRELGVFYRRFAGLPSAPTGGNPLSGLTSRAAKESHRPTQKAPMTGRPDWSSPHNPVSQHFTVLEVTNGDPERIPVSGSNEEKEILRLAAELDKLREAWGYPIGVTSWYRPYEINLAVGGVPNSTHIEGGAADIYTMDGRDAEFEIFVDSKWGGGVGYGVASGRGFTHVDLYGGGGHAGAGGFETGAFIVRWVY